MHSQGTCQLLTKTETSSNLGLRNIASCVLLCPRMAQVLSPKWQLVAYKSLVSWLQHCSVMLSPPRQEEQAVVCQLWESLCRPDTEAFFWAAYGSGEYAGGSEEPGSSRAGAV